MRVELVGVFSSLPLVVVSCFGNKFVYANNGVLGVVVASFYLTSVYGVHRHL